MLPHYPEVEDGVAIQHSSLLSVGFIEVASRRDPNRAETIFSENCCPVILSQRTVWVQLWILFLPQNLQVFYRL